MLISQIQAMMKSEINNGNDIQQILENVNKMVVRYTPKDKFVTLFYGIFDKSNNQFDYATAGHNFPIWLRENGQFDTLSQGGPALGLTEKAKFKTGKIKLVSDDIILFYTDGVTETMDNSKEQYSENRLNDLLVKSRHLSSQKIVDEILDDLNDFNDDEALQDDRTILVLKISQRA